VLLVADGVYFFFSQIDELASFSDSPAPSVTRVLYTDKDVQARR
jgi:sulfur transfer complex TusBCD TusB component (DsrH family)